MELLPSRLGKKTTSLPYRNLTILRYTLVRRAHNQLYLEKAQEVLLKKQACSILDGYLMLV